MIEWADIQRYCDAIAREFKPRRIVVFGSYARHNRMKQHSKPEQVSPVIARTLLEANLLCVGFPPALGLMLQVATSKDADFVCAAFGTAFGLSSQIAASKDQSSCQREFVFSNPATTA